MTREEFFDNYCVLCGSQRCGGIDDEEMREGCTYYQSYVSSNTSKAHSMFKELDYVRDDSSPGIIEYHHEGMGCSIRFMNEMEIFDVVGGAYRDVLPAIAQQCKELGWE